MGTVRFVQRVCDTRIIREELLSRKGASFASFFKEGRTISFLAEKKQKTQRGVRMAQTAFLAYPLMERKNGRFA